MSEIVNNRPDAPRGYGLKLILAATAASAAAAAFWVSRNMPLAHAERWQDGALAAGALALGLTWLASQRTPQQKSDARARQERRAAFVRSRLNAASTLRGKPAGEGKARQAVTPDVAPLDAERNRLLKAGLTEHEVSQILIARESGAGAGKSSFGTGVATGVLNNIDAVVTHVRSLIPNLKSDLTRMLDREADSATRISGAVSLGVKSAAVVVVGYFVYLEALQFRAAAYKAWADACIARQQAEINYSTMNELMSGAGNNLDGDCKHQ